jgi:hypothetical protein
MKLRERLVATVDKVDADFQKSILAGAPLRDPKDRIERPFDAFLVYGHGRDSHTAAAIQAALHRIGKPWYRGRAMQIFRDEENLAVLGPSLWDALGAALNRSKFLVLLASERSAKSVWVNRQIEYWFNRFGRGAAEILIVVTSGSIAWNRQRGDFDWEQSTALPRALIGVCSEEPLYLDLRWAQSDKELSLRNERFLNAMVTLAATIQGRPQDEIAEIAGEEIQQLRRTRRIAWETATTIVVLTLSLVVTLVYLYNMLRSS